MSIVLWQCPYFPSGATSKSRFSPFQSCISSYTRWICTGIHGPQMTPNGLRLSPSCFLSRHPEGNLPTTIGRISNNFGAIHIPLRSESMLSCFRNLVSKLTTFDTFWRFVSSVWINGIVAKKHKQDKEVENRSTNALLVLVILLNLSSMRKM